MSKISELGPITGANTRPEDLFVIVNLIQGDDGTKNITRKELVQAIQYEIFNRITITGGTIRNVSMSDSTLTSVTINTSTFTNGRIETTRFIGGSLEGSIGVNLEIANSDFSDGTGNNNVFTYTTIDLGRITNSSANNITMSQSVITGSQFNDGTGNNVTLTNSTIDDSEYNNVTIDQGTANGLILTNITIDEIILEDAFMSNSTIVTTNFSNGDIFDAEIYGNTQIWDVAISNSDIRDTDLDNVVITRSIFANGTIYDTAISNSNIFDTTANNIVITNSELNDSTANNTSIVNSDFSDGTGNNNVFTNTTMDQSTLQNSVIANTAFQGTMTNTVAENITINNSAATELQQNKSTFTDGNVEDSLISNSTIDDSKLVDFDMDLTKKFEAPIDEDSYFALKNVKTGDVEQMTYRQLYDEFSRKTEKALKVYVSADGDDDNDGTLLRPVQTLKRAEELALEKAGGSYNRNDINNAVHISVGPGTYYVDEPISLPDDCSMTSTAGQYATVIQKKPGWERTNGIQVGSGCYVQGFSYMNFEVDNFDHPEGGFAIVYRPGALMRRSPYIRDSSQLSNFNRLDVEPPLNPFNSKGTIYDLGQEFYITNVVGQANFEIDDEVVFSSGATGFISYIDDLPNTVHVRNLKGNVEPGDILTAQRGGTAEVVRLGIDDFPNRLIGRGGGCALMDRAVLDPDSLYTYLLCFGFTPRTQNGTGYVAKNGAGINGIGSLSIFTRQAFFALDGGQVTLNNSGSQFGDISMRASGKTTIVKPAEAPKDSAGQGIALLSNTDFADALAENKQAIVDDMVNFLTANTTHPASALNSDVGLGYQGYNADKCFRDTGIIVENTGLDIATKGNYWGRLNGITYRSPISYVVVNEQLDETVGSIEHLKDSIEHIFRNANTEVNDRVSTSIDETLNILKNGEEFANNIIFTDTGNAPATAAREVVQDNREFIIEEFIDWLDNNEEFYAYDSAKCKRDVREFILPAVKYDTMLDTNYNSVTAGNAYYFKAAKNVIGAQREETIAAYERLRFSTDELTQANSAVFAAEAYEKFNEIIGILKNDGDKFTPTAVTYTPSTGDFEITIGTHSLDVGRYILLEPEGFTFTCATDGNVVQLKHPRKSDPAFKSALPITSTTATTITVNVGSTGYNGVHTLVSVKDSAVAVLGSAITFSDDTAISADKRNARAKLQHNRTWIQNYMMNWADEEWFFYDSEKCQRDTKEYIVPAAMRDMQLGTNFNAIQAGIAYRGGTSKTLLTDQLTETVGAFSHLRDEVSDTMSDSIAIAKSKDSFNEIIGIMNTGARKFTPETATYDPVTGVMTLTLPNHSYEIGDMIIVEKESITFSCGTPAVEISHPRATDPLFRKPMQITNVAGDVITVNAGDANGYTGAHTFVRAKANAVKTYAEVKRNYTPTGSTYDPASGRTTFEMVGHNLSKGDYIVIDETAITYQCSNNTHTNVQISHPRVTDPIFNNMVEITDVPDANTIAIDAGAISDGYLGAHTFVSADADAIKHMEYARGNGYTPTAATYNVNTGIMTVTIGEHDLRIGEKIKINEGAMTFSCGSPAVEISHPRASDPAFNTDLTISAVTADSITVNVGDAGGYTGAHTFVRAEPFAITSSSVYTGKFTPSTGTYDPLTGDMTLEIGQHSLPVGKYVMLADESIRFSCANTTTSDIGEISHPRDGEPAFRKPVRISAVTDTAITMNVGNAGGYTGAHTFVSAKVDSVDTNAIYWTDPAKVASYHTPIDVDYNPTTGDMIIDFGGSHDFTTNDHIEFKPASVVLSCVNTATSETIEIAHPRIGEPNYEFPLEVTAVAANTITVNPGSAGGYTGTHTFVRADYDAVVKLPERVTRNGALARKQLQANKAFLQAEVDAWLKDNYFVYDDKRCARDTGYILDAVRRDMATGSNVNAVFAGLAYRTGNASAENVVNNQLTETVGAITWLKGKINTTITSGAAGLAADAAFDEIIDIMNNGAGNANSRTFGTSYVSQDTLDARGLLQSNKAFLQDEVTAWIANTHPDLSYNVADCERDLGYFIDAVSWDVQHGSNAATVNNARVYFDNAVSVLAEQEKPVTAEAYAYIADIAGGLVRQEVVATQQNATTQTFANTLTPTFAAYNPVTGIMTLTIPSHGQSVGDYIVIAENGITFECGSPATQISHPRATDPYFNTPIEITKVDGDILTMYVGTAQGYAEAHTFVSAATDCVRPSVAPAVGTEVEKLFRTISDIIEEDDYKTTFGIEGYEDTDGYVSGGEGYGTDGINTGLTTPTIKEPTLSGTGYDAATNVMFEEIAGATAKYQTEIIDYIRETYNGLAYQEDKCPRDVGYIVDAVSEDLEYGGDSATINAARYYFEGAINVLPLYQREPTRLAFEHIADLMEDVVTETAITPTTGNALTQDTSGLPADAATGVEAKRLANIISNITDDRLVIPEYTGSLDITQKPEARLKNLPSANTDIAPLIEPSRTYARKALQMNKGFIQDEVVGYINDTYFTYDEDKCARDVGYIIDAVRRDVETNSDYSSKYAGRAYRAGNPSTDTVINDQLAETIEAIKYVRKDIEAQLSGTALTTARGAFDNIINIMKDGVSGLTYNFGTSRIGVSEGNSTDGLVANRTFLQKEGRAYFEQTYPVLWAALSAEQRDKCERDIGYMVDAVSWDIRHGSNVAMRDVASLYFDQGTSVLPADQKTETAAIFEHVATVAERILLKLPVTPTTGNTETVSTAFGNVLTQVAQDVEDLFNIVSNMITEDSLFGLPAAVFPDTVAVGATGYADASDVAKITARKTTLQNGVNSYLQSKFDYLEYDSEKCRRDTGYMVDAISHDIQYGGNSAMWNAAQIYFVNMTNLLPLEQREPTKKAFTHMAEVMRKVIRNEDVDLRIGKRFTPTNATYNPLTGVMEVTLGAHNLAVGDYIMFEKESITFECGSPAVQISHPRETDGSFAKPLRIDAKTATTITVQAGYAKGYAGAHTFVSATDNAVKVIRGQSFKQDKSSLAARREIAMEAKHLALMIADIADDNNPDNLPARIEPNMDWVPSIFKTEKDKVDNALEALTTSMVNHISTTYKGISYPKEKCRRDVGIMLDAISHDVQYETNYATRLAANMYFDNATSVLPFDQRQQTADFYEEMANYISKIITGDVAGEAGGPSAATAVEGEWAADMVRIVEEAIRRDGLDAVPELIEPNTAWVDDSKVSAGKMIDGKLGDLADDVTKFISDNFTIVDYSKAKCRRDSGYIIDAMSWDLNYGGNLASRWNADFYYWNNELRIPEDTRVATAQSYRQLGKIVSDVTVGKYPGQKLRPEMGSEAQQAQAKDLGMIFYNALFYNTPRALGRTIQPDFMWEDKKNKAFRFSRDILLNNKVALQKEVQRFITSTYKFIDLPKTYRDAGNLIDIIQNDLRFTDPSQNPPIEGSDKAMRSFAAALYDIDSKSVFPVFNPPSAFANWRDLRFKGAGTVTERDALTNPKRWDAFVVSATGGSNPDNNDYVGEIHYWNGTGWIASGHQNNVDLLVSFYKAWERMRDYINTNIAPNAAHRAMITELIDDVLISTVLRPNFLAFGSLVESIAHQFNGASAGVNRNALPLNFRNVGAAIGATASVLSEDGGRIRWSGSDELNNQYFARGLRINGRTGRIEGRPFTSSVRKLARRASNSRAVL